jgi:hypothetical protein
MRNTLVTARWRKVTDLQVRLRPRNYGPADAG